MRTALIALAAALFAAPAARADVPAGNLLANPGAEAAAGAAGNEIVPVPNWSVEGNFTAVQYGASGFLTTDDGAAVGGGANFFAGGPSAATSAASQRVDVSAAAQEIDAGGVPMTLAALLGGFATQTDSATVTATPLNSASLGIGTPLTLPAVTADDRASVTKLIARTATATLPAGTRSIVVRIAATRDEGDYNDGYVDNVSLTLGSGGGKTVAAEPVSGTVRVKRPGSASFVALSGAAGIPLGSTVDAKHGRVRLTAGAGGGIAEFYDGIFKVTQKGGITDLALVETLASCKRASAAAKKPKSRKLWGSGKGAFRTSGKYSAATVRGTTWLVQDSCAGTLTRVTQGSVNVRDNVKHRTILLRAGQRYTAKPRR